MGLNILIDEAQEMLSLGVKPKQLFSGSYVIQDPNFSIHVGRIVETNRYYLTKNNICKANTEINYVADKPDETNLIRKFYEKIEEICQ